MPKLYMISIFAEKHEGFTHYPVLLMAENEEEATGAGLLLARKLNPSSEGFSRWLVNVSLVEIDKLALYAEKVLGRQNLLAAARAEKLLDNFGVSGTLPLDARVEAVIETLSILAELTDGVLEFLDKEKSRMEAKADNRGGKQ